MYFYCENYFQNFFIYCFKKAVKEFVYLLFKKECVELIIFARSSNYYFTFFPLITRSLAGAQNTRTAALQRRKTPTTTNRCPGYDTKQPDGEVPVMLELWGMRSTLSLPSLPGPPWPGVVAHDRILFMDQIKVNCALMLNWIVWFKTVLTFKLRTNAKLNYLK